MVKNLKIISFSLISILFYYTIGVAAERDEDADTKKFQLTRQAKVNPIISGMKFDKRTQMAITVTFTPLKDSSYEHACVVYEYYKYDRYWYETVHLGQGAEDPDRCYGYGTEPRVSQHSPHEILPKFVGDFEDKEVNGMLKTISKAPIYKKHVSFIVRNNFDEVKTRIEEDRRTIKFSFAADLWSNRNYNCCSYANKLLGYSGITVNFKKFFKTDGNFKIALIKYAEENPVTSKLH
mgnify:CR=1 FL=1